MIFDFPQQMPPETFVASKISGLIAARCMPRYDDPDLEDAAQALHRKQVQVAQLSGMIEAGVRCVTLDLVPNLYGRANTERLIKKI